MDSREFYDQIAGRYDGAIGRCVPRYAQMLDTLLHYVPDELAPRRIIELGCGSGNLTRRLLARYPDAEIEAVDFSAAMLETVSRGAPARLRTTQAEFLAYRRESSSAELVVSSISLHHLDDPEKARLFSHVHDWLVPGGAFCYSDQFAGETAETYAKHMEGWREEARALGATEEEWDEWMRHQEIHDHHAPLRAQLGWLTDAGFGPVDCVWRYLLWTIVLARR